MLYMVAIGRWLTNGRTKVYVDKRLGRGQVRLGAIRCLKCYIAPEFFYISSRHNDGKAR